MAEYQVGGVVVDSEKTYRGDEVLRFLSICFDNGIKKGLVNSHIEPYEAGYEEGFHKGQESCMVPAGYWIERVYANEWGEKEHFYTCSVCNRTEKTRFDFCHCGADMRP